MKNEFLVSHRASRSAFKVNNRRLARLVAALIAMCLGPNGWTQTTLLSLQLDGIWNAVQTNGTSSFVIGTNGNGILTISRENGGAPYRRSGLVQFDLANVPTNRVVVSASLSAWGDSWTMANAVGVWGLDCPGGDLVGCTARGSLTPTEVYAGPHLGALSFQGYPPGRKALDVSGQIAGLVQAGVGKAAFFINEFTGTPYRNGSVVVSSFRLEIQVGLTMLRLVSIPSTNGAGAWGMSFPSRSGVLYDLLRSEDLQHWQNVHPAISGTGGLVVVTNPPGLPMPAAFFRLREHQETE